MHVLVILNDMTNYCEALREISAARKEVPGRRATQATFIPTLQRFTSVRAESKQKGLDYDGARLTMPEDDKTHPVPDLTGYITEGQIILSRSLHRKAISPRSMFAELVAPEGQRYRQRQDPRRPRRLV